MSDKTKKEVKPILDRPNIVRTKVRIKGLTSLIVNAVNEEVVNSILKTQTTGKSARREPKNVENEFLLTHSRRISRRLLPEEFSFRLTGL